MNLVTLSDEIREGLFDQGLDIWLTRRECAENIRKEAASEFREDVANKAWFLESVCTSRFDMIRIWEMLRDEKFRDAWIELEKVELACHWLTVNAFYPLEIFEVPDLARMVANWQSLYPYKVFISPEFLISREECSICGQSMGPWSSCPHTTGRVYNGEFCSRIVKEASIGQLALVSDPVRKYSVVIPKTEDDSDPMDYRQVEWVRDRCDGPFCKWSAKRGQMMHPHSSFICDPKELCPCGSERSYEACCLVRDGVLMPHIDVTFEHRVDPALLGIHLGERRVSD